MVKPNVDGLVASYTSDYFAFQAYFKSVNGAHVGAHTTMGGNMTGLCSNGTTSPDCVPGPKRTPNDPLFFLHRAIVDKIRRDWQNRDAGKNSRTEEAPSKRPRPSQASSNPNGLGTYVDFETPTPSGMWNATLWDVMDTNASVLYYPYA